ncbi:uncharacterized protein LOC116913928 [Rattus rattus]|uniref:uncharacterized protein LOC116913928 n=1 Tax=Rattus rattus TaxID=10117 RepID=UPI0013F381F0|nr:uncharacterized protein LOC116913928 [Rattus rattus]
MTAYTQLTPSPVYRLGSQTEEPCHLPWSIHGVTSLNYDVGIHFIIIYFLLLFSLLLSKRGDHITTTTTRRPGTTRAPSNPMEIDGFDLEDALNDQNNLDGPKKPSTGEGGGWSDKDLEDILRGGGYKPDKNKGRNVALFGNTWILLKMLTIRPPGKHVTLSLWQIRLRHVHLSCAVGSHSCGWGFICEPSWDATHLFCCS